MFAERQPEILTDPHWPTLAAQMERIVRTGADVATLVEKVTTERALPADSPARSLDYRLANAVPPPTGTRSQIPAAEPTTARPAPQAPATGQQRDGPSP